MYRKHTKIVATVGPASNHDQIVKQLIKKGVNVFRLNFSHGDYRQHEESIDRIRRISRQLKLPVAILQDLGGPKIRIGDFADKEINLLAGRTFILTTRQVVGRQDIVSLNYKKLPQEVKAGDILFLDDGKKKLKVEAIKNKTDIICRVLVGGRIKSRRGLNAPDPLLSIRSLTPKDRRDVLFGLKHGVDFIAMSFVRSRSDIESLRRLVDSQKGRAKIIAKIETKEAIEDLDNIIAAADGVMVARGDLAIEIPAEDVPVVQKDIIAKCNQTGRPVITATQMLGSMALQPFPTRAEVNDVANAIFDGTDAVMLSEETATGLYPILAVELMQRIACRIEQTTFHEDRLSREHLSFKSVVDAFSYAAINMTHEINGRAIVALSRSGYTARMVARYRPSVPLLVLTPEEITYRQLALTYACYPVLVPPFNTTKKAVAIAKKTLLKKGLVAKGDQVIIIAGIPFNVSGSINLLLAEKI
ncbi:MAG: pyruvate kinase [Candidatus Paceibacterota bacterium]